MKQTMHMEFPENRSRRPAVAISDWADKSLTPKWALILQGTEKELFWQFSKYLTCNIKNNFSSFPNIWRRRGRPLELPGVRCHDEGPHPQRSQELQQVPHESSFYSTSTSKFLLLQSGLEGWGKPYPRVHQMFYTQPNLARFSLNILGFFNHPPS